MKPQMAIKYKIRAKLQPNIIAKVIKYQCRETDNVRAMLEQGHTVIQSLVEKYGPYS